jgi:hypothetical protein
MTRVSEKLADIDWNPGRTSVVIGALVGVAWLIYLLATHDDPYAAFIKAAVAAGVVIGLVSVAQRRWSGDKIKRASLNPEGAELEFDSIEAVNARVDAHVAKLNETIHDVETKFEDRFRRLERSVERPHDGVKDADKAVEE